MHTVLIVDDNATLRRVVAGWLQQWGARPVAASGARQALDLTREDPRTRDRYGRNQFGQSCLLSRRLIERGVRFCTVNMFETVFNEITWDIHGSAPFSPIECYQNLVGPMFDKAYASLLEELKGSGLLENTIHHLLSIL